MVNKVVMTLQQNWTKLRHEQRHNIFHILNNKHMIDMEQLASCLSTPSYNSTVTWFVKFGQRRKKTS